MLVLGSRWDPWRANYALLQRAVDAAGYALARQPYEAFVQPGVELSFSEVVEGVPVHFAVEVYRGDRDGTLWVRVQAQAELPTLLRIRPAFAFRKLPDGSAYVQR